MATYTLCPYESRQYSDQLGNPLNGGLINTYLSGTSTPVFTFSDSSGTLNTNPVVCDASGRCTIYLDPLLSYKFIITNSLGVQSGPTVDPVSLNQALTVGTSTAFQTTSRGTAPGPAFSFTADTDTGLYSSGINTLNVSTGGVERVRFFASGGVSIGDTTDPGATNLRVAGTSTLVGAVTSSGLLTVNASGTNSFTGAVNGDEVIQITNTTSGTAARAYLGAVAGTTGGFLQSVSQGYTTSGINIQSSVLVLSNSTAGLSLGAIDALGMMRFFTGGQTERARIHASGGVSIGDTTDPGATNLRVAGTSALIGNVQIGGTNITDAVAAPTITSGAGSTATIAGKVFAFTISCSGSGFAASIVIAFNMTFSNTPAVTVSCNQIGVKMPVSVGASTTGCTLGTNDASVFSNGTVLNVHVRGF